MMSGRKDVVVVSSVSCIYGMGSPVALNENIIEIHRGQIIDRNALLRKLVGALYVRNDIELKRGCFRVKGDTVDVAMAYSEAVLRITFWDDEIDSLEEVDAITFDRLARFEEYKLYPAHFKSLLRDGDLCTLSAVYKNSLSVILHIKRCEEPVLQRHHAACSKQTYLSHS